jgi:hypothetical protein
VAAVAVCWVVWVVCWEVCWAAADVPTPSLDCLQLASAELKAEAVPHELVAQTRALGTCSI